MAQGRARGWWEGLPLPLRRMRDLERLAAALTDLERSPRFHAGATRWSLAGMRRLHGALGRPLSRRPVVHVAGSKGKGSVCLLLESLLRAQGRCSGTYLSPHVDRWNERLRVGGRDLATGRFLAVVEEVLSAAQRAGLTRPTLFETLTAGAFREFERAGVQVAILETGIGGRLDCTNVLSRTVGVITAVEREHRAVLGDRLSDIAREKAGILKRGCPAVSGLDPSSVAARTLRAVAVERGADLWEWGRAFRVRREREGFSLRLADGRRWRLPEPAGGPHARRNGALAVVALVRLAATWPSLGLSTEESVLAQGLGAARMPARCERVAQVPPIYRDGAHTPGSLASACTWVRERHPRGPLVLVLGLNQDKEWRACLRRVSGTVGLLIATPVPGGRSRAPQDLVDGARSIGLAARASADLEQALRVARGKAGARGSILVAGSFWLAGSVPHHRTEAS